MKAGPKVLIASDETGWHTRQLQQALKARGWDSRCVDLEDCRFDGSAAWHGLVLPGLGAALPEAVIVRGIAGGSFEQVTKRLSILHALQALGVPVYNEGRAIERSVDKAMTSWLLQQAGVPTPAAWAMESSAQAQRLVMRESAAGRALVLKPLFGSQGKGLQKLGWVDGQHVPLPALDGPYGQLAYLQRYVPGATHDWRVLVIGGRAAAAMQRSGTGWVHNVAQGARCQPAPLSPALADIAERASSALGLDYAGVDVVPTPAGGLLVLEVNGVAAWRGLQQVCPFNIAQALVADLLDRKLALRQGTQERSA